MPSPLILIAAFIALGLLIFVHETGHFLVAKLFGVRVIVYSFGFGHRLFGIEVGGTDYRVSLIPFGGYVRMWGADPFEVEEHEQEQAAQREVDTIVEPARAPRRGEWALQDVAVWKRLLIYAAGPAANLVIPFFVFAVLFMAGQPQVAPVVGTVLSGSPAALAGLQPGDTVLEVAGLPVRTWMELEERWFAVSEDHATVGLTVERGDRRLSMLLEPDSAWTDGSPDDYGLDYLVAAPIVGVLHSDSPAGRAGLLSGDRVVSVDGEEIETWPQLQRHLAQADERVTLAWTRGDASHQAELLRTDTWIPAAVRPLLGQAEDIWGLQSANLVVGAFSEGSAAQAAGAREGAYLLAIDGDRIESWQELLRGVAVTMDESSEERKAQPLEMTVLQDDQAFRLRVEPAVIQDTDYRGRYYWRPLIGVSSAGGWAASAKVSIHYPVGQALTLAATDTVGLVHFTLEQISLLVTGQADAKKSLGGPVEIMHQAAKAAKAGWMHYARLLGMISISVGIFNLLPVPVLDGGHLLFYSLEAIRGRPVSPMLRERAQIVGVMLLVALMIFVLVNDLGRLPLPAWLGGGGG